MVLVKHTKSEIQASVAVAKSLVPQAVMPCKISLVNRLLSLENKTENLTTLLDHRAGHYELNDNFLKVFAGVTLTYFPSDKLTEGSQPSEKDVALFIHLEFQSIFVMPPAPIPEDIEKVGIPAFSKITALQMCWPYLREEISHLTTMAGVPFQLPFLIIESEDENTLPTSVTKTDEIAPSQIVETEK